MDRSVYIVSCVLLFFFLFINLSCEKTYKQTAQQEIVIEENNEVKAKLIEISKIKERIKFYEDGLRWRINSNDEKYKEEIEEFKSELRILRIAIEPYELEEKKKQDQREVEERIRQRAQREAKKQEIASFKLWELQQQQERIREKELKEAESSMLYENTLKERMVSIISQEAGVSKEETRKVLNEEMERRGLMGYTGGGY